MKHRRKEMAKFFSGVAAMETILHWTLMFSGVLPLKLLGITLTPLMNAVGMVFWPVATWLLICYAWLKDGWRESGRLERLDENG